MEIEDKDFLNILNTLEKRTKYTRVATLTFVYVLFISMIVVIGSVVSIKIRNDNAINQFVTGVLDKNKTYTGVYAPDIPHTIKERMDQPQNSATYDDEHKLTRKTLQPGDLITFKRDTTDKIADGIVSIIVSFSILLFIGYVMRVSIVFIKYYMQLSNDYENQKVAFLLSRGKPDTFSQILDTLRNNTIGFDKTPKLPQEKIITGLIEAIGLAKQKAKGDN
ncbi:hypothetical protein [Enterobacter roggenkampii]|uniref:hypothetical protein n=1 Tax=Enterobacter roggenkampii TaxID=1812935 RepID=UPI00388DF74E